MKIALCISGQPRGIPLSCEFLRDNVIIPNGITDIFVHTWYHPDFDNQPFDTAQPAQAARVGKWKPESDKIIEEILKPTVLLCERPNDFPEYATFPGPDSAVQSKIASIFYGMWKANELKREYEISNGFKYDIVIRTRLDLIYSMPVVINELITASEPVSEYVYTPHMYQAHRQNDEYFTSNGIKYSSLSDTFAFSDSENMDKFTSVYPDFRKLHTVLYPYVYTAAQPSHDWAAREPLTDFSINAVGTMNMLELTRLHCPKATFIFTSTNKVYGDNPNKLNLIEEEKRYENYREIFSDRGKNAPKKYTKGSIAEDFPIDQTKHSVFGASKVAADVMVQEYGRYFGMNTVCFRGGCLTGANHQGAELHGFLSYLVKCIVHNKPYTIFGYKGKQVRDNIHSSDLIQMFWEYFQRPRPGEVYNAGGGIENSISMLEAIDSVNEILKSIDPSREEWKNYVISEEPRIGDHMWYVTDLSKFKRDYPTWKGITVSVKDILTEIVKKEMTS